MKRNFFTPVLLFLSLFFYVGLASCKQEAPDFSKKERDPRLIGTWYLIKQEGVNLDPGFNVLEFKADGSCVGFSYPGGKRLFYTKGNHQLYLFVYGEGLKLSNRTYEEYYLIERDTLYLWLSKDEMLARQYKRALAYTRVSKS